MFKKTLISEFFTTINLSIFLNTLSFFTYKLPIIRYWNSVTQFENEFLSYIWNLESKVLSFYNWRSAIYYTLKIIWVDKTDEVIVSAYTCVSVVNAVIQSWAKIVYSDINKNNLWLEIDDIKSNITKKTKVIIVQHTFWKPSNIIDILIIAKRKNILVIEDCAHSLWSKIDWIKTGSFGDFAIFSTWRDKVISWVTWWILLVNNNKYFWELDKVRKSLTMPSIWLTLKNLFYNISAYFAFKTYDFYNLWKIIIFLSRKFGLITEILTQSEKKCSFKKFNYALPNSLAFLAWKELKKIKYYSTKRNTISEYYDEMINNNYIKIIFRKSINEKNNYYRYPILLKSEEIKNEFYDYMKQNWVLVWNTWNWINIVPLWTNIINTRYISWSCIYTEDICKTILTLPNHMSVKFNDAKKIVQLINNFKKTNA